MSKYQCSKRSDEWNAFCLAEWGLTGKLVTEARLVNMFTGDLRKLRDGARINSVLRKTKESEVYFPRGAIREMKRIGVVSYGKYSSKVDWGRVEYYLGLPCNVGLIDTG